MQCASSMATSGGRSPRSTSTERRVREPLGGDVDELVGAVARCALERSRRSAELEGRGEVGRRDAARVERADLVLHQRDQRRDDEGGARAAAVAGNW